MTARVVAFAFGAMLLAGAPCLAQSEEAPAKPVAPGGIRVTTKAPDPDKWYAQKNANGTQRIFKCKPLACPDPQTVTFAFLKSPTRHPDPKALERFAKEQLPKSIRAANAAREILSDGTDKIETIESKTAKLKGYPSVLNETKITRGKSEAYVWTAIIFAGPLMVRVQSSSRDRQLAQNALKEFIDVMRLEEGPPPVSPPPSNSSPQKPLEGI